MKLITTNGGYLEEDDLNYLGGRVSFIKAIKMGGIGSPKIEYLNGIPEIDKVKDINIDINYVNFEILNKGIVLRYHKHYSSITLLIQFEEINQILIKKNNKARERDCELHIFFVNNQIIKLKCNSTFKSQVEAFFKKDCFSGLIKESE
jgi:hypothetical protein